MTFESWQNISCHTAFNHTTISDLKKNVILIDTGASKSKRKVNASKCKGISRKSIYPQVHILMFILRTLPLLQVTNAACNYWSNLGCIHQVLILNNSDARGSVESEVCRMPNTSTCNSCLESSQEHCGLWKAVSFFCFSLFIPFRKCIIFIPVFCVCFPLGL